MDTERLEKQLSIWNKFMYMGLGSAITLVASSPGEISQADVVWLLVQITITPVGFFLLFGKRWKTLPLSNERINTGLGYLLAGWLSLFVPLILGAGSAYTLFLLVYTVFLGLIYGRVQKKFSNSDEMFP
jgi:hypothetical protein